MSTLMRGCHPDHPCRHGPTPVVIYVAPPEHTASANALARSCENFVRNRGWPHVATVVEDGPSGTLESRKGWRQVLAHTSAEAEIIVVPSLAHLSLSEEDFEALKSELHQRDVLLVAVN